MFGDIYCNIWDAIVGGIRPYIKWCVLPTDNRYYDISVSRKLIPKTIDRKEAGPPIQLRHSFLEVRILS